MGLGGLRPCLMKINTPQSPAVYLVVPLCLEPWRSGVPEGLRNSYAENPMTPAAVHDKHTAEAFSYLFPFDASSITEEEGEAEGGHGYTRGPHNWERQRGDSVGLSIPQAELVLLPL